MSAVVHILASVRKAELLPAALLVFRTLRTGFPFSEVRVHGNGLDTESAAEVRRAARAARAHFENGPMTAHDVWIESAILNLHEPFWVVDTDVVFFGKMPDELEQTKAEFVGRLEPEFLDPCTGMVHVERLHTCAMWIDPVAVRNRMREWMAQVPVPWRGLGTYTFVRQSFIPRHGQMPGPDGKVASKPSLFYDTMAGCWQAGWGTWFNDHDDGMFEHLHCGSYSDTVAGALPGLREMHAAVFQNPELARGLRQHQAQWYLERQTVGATGL